MEQAFSKTTRKWEAVAFATRARDGLSQAEDMLRFIESTVPPFDQSNLLEPLNDLLVTIRNVADEANLLSRVHPDVAVQQAADEAFRQTQQVRTKLLQSRQIYRALCALDPSAVADAVALRAVALIRQDMLRVGVELTDAERQQVVRLRDELVDLEQAFGRNVRTDVRSISLVDQSELEGLPADYVTTHPPSADGVISISTRAPDYFPFMEHSTSERARLVLSREFYNRGVPANLEVLQRMLAVRHELATTLGYAHWADYASEETMVGSARNARSFLEQLRDLTRHSVLTELEGLLAFKRRLYPSAGSIGMWEALYYDRLVRSERLGARTARAEQRPFKYSTVRDAILQVMGELFGMTFSHVAVAPAWHSSVESFKVAINGRPAGLISLDMHPRKYKLTSAASYTLRTGVLGRQFPHAVLVCNFPDAESEVPPRQLLRQRDVVTFLHEFGHLVHAIARGSQRWIRLSTPAERDFNEAASQLLEDLIFDKQVLGRLLTTSRSSESAIEQLVEDFLATREFGRGLRVRQLLFRSILSLSLHDRDPGEVDIGSLVDKLAHLYLPYTLVPDTHLEASFEHVVWYPGTHYTYLWSQAIVRDLRTEFPDGLFDVGRMRRYSDLVLRPGGSKPATTLLEEFLGRPFSIDTFREWIATPAQ
jgi:thimet oligopeptidase